MRRIGKVILKYTEQELIQVLYDGIVTAQQVSIESMSKDTEGNFVFNCIEGINNIAQGEQIKKINFELLLPSKPKLKKVYGMVQAVKDILANGVKCPQEKIFQELRLKGFDKTDSYIRTYIKSNKESFVECDPKVFN